MHAAWSTTVLREDGPAILPVEEEREEIDMGKITITEKQEAIIRRLNDPLYTVEFLKEWVNRNDNVFINQRARGPASYGRKRILCRRSRNRAGERKRR